MPRITLFPAAAAMVMACLTAQAEPAAQFYRVVADSTTRITRLDFDGYMAWSNAPAGATCRVEVADGLTSSGAWRTLVRTATNALRVFSTNIPPGMVYIPAGMFVMGNSYTNDGGDQAELVEIPVHTVHVSAFCIDTHEVSKALWDSVAGWARSNGYSFSTDAGYGKDASHPATSNNWYDCVKWCNARSELEGLTPCYYTNTAKTLVYRELMTPLSNAWVNWNANGYRLPTEAEWEKAARGGHTGRRFPWGEYIAHSNANYVSAENFHTNTYADGRLCWYDVSPTRGYHPMASTNTLEPYTMPCGSFEPNAFGLYDTAGNVNEWVWDWYQPNFYTVTPSSDPRGPAVPTLVSGSYHRVLRGGGWHAFDAALCRNAYRMGNPASEVTDNRGFRCVRRAD